MPTPAVIISGVAVKVRRCSCGFTVFEADAVSATEARATFDVVPADVMQMVNGRDAIYWQPRSTPSFARHVCAVLLDE